MDLNADFSARAVVHAADIPWVASPMKGVDRRMLDRMGDEVARATTIVRYAPGSAFSPHVHTGGEEYLVLEGTFQDEHGDFPAGTYVRNPPQSSHTPRSDDGAVIMVKLWQFDLDDRTAVVVRPDDMTPKKVDHDVRITELHRDKNEVVKIEDWAANAVISIPDQGGIEVFVIDGGFTEGRDTFKTHSWLRVPNGQPLSAIVGPNGARVWTKTGHLWTAPTPPVT
ncbi:MAG: cupin domain-containing protein [Yoonia sp.]|nr:cupin domain-containing protein [Yoonia sp.]